MDFVNVSSHLIPSSDEEKRLSLHAICGAEAGQGRREGRWQRANALKYVLSSSTLFCCHCTEDNCSRCQGEEWILPGWLWPSYLSLGYGTDARAGVTFSLFFFFLIIIGALQFYLMSPKSHLYGGPLKPIFWRKKNRQIKTIHSTIRSRRKFKRTFHALVFKHFTLRKVGEYW